MRRSQAVRNRPEWGPWWMAIASLAIFTPGCYDAEQPRIADAAAVSMPQAASRGCDRISQPVCEVDPVGDLQAGACDQLLACLGEGITAERPLSPAISCDQPVLPAKPGPLEVAAVAFSADFDGVPSQAAYLFVRGEDGWCPAHELLEPQWNHGGYCTSEFAFHWTETRAGDSGPRLDVRSDRVCHMPLDQEEVEAGESDVASQGCAVSAFEVENSTLIAAGRAEFDRPCVEVSQEEAHVFR